MIAKFVRPAFDVRMIFTLLLHMFARRSTQLTIGCLTACLAVACLPGALAAADAADVDDSFGERMTAAWQELASRDVEQAKVEIEEGAKQAQTEAQQAEAGRMQLLALCIERFWREIDAELKRMIPGDELKIGDTMASVVQSDTKGITLHIEGKNQKHTRRDLPTSWAQALADHRFDSSAPNKLLMGAFLAVEQGDRKKARQLWERAKRGEPSAGELLALLSSPHIPVGMTKDGKTVEDQNPPDAGDSETPVTKADVPSGQALAAAQKQFKETYAGELRTAKTPERKLELSETLVEAAGTADDEAFRWVLLSQALELTAATADLPAIEKMVGRLDKHFKIEQWEVEAGAITRASAAAKGEMIAPVVHRALELLGTWESQDAAAKKAHAKIAQKLDQATLAAAHRANDTELVGAVIDRKKSSRAN
jgi:hypothetical protein